MKKFFAVFTIFFLSVPAAFATLSNEDNNAGLAPKSLKDDAFVVETDDASSADTLDRISGQFDMGFASPDQSYHSEHHYKPGPMNKAAAEEAAQRNNS